MRQISARIPDETHARLKALSASLGVSQADVITRALAALEAALPEHERRSLTQTRGRS
jgi:predicted DNA-binding protein